MTIKIETAGIEVQDLQTAPRVTEACDAIVAVEKVITKDGVILLILYIIAATKDSQIGRVHPEYLSLPNGKSESEKILRRRLLCVLDAFNLVTEDEIESGEPIEFDPELMVGRQAIVQFTARKNSPLQVAFLGFWKISDQKAPFVRKKEMEVNND